MILSILYHTLQKNFKTSTISGDSASPKLIESNSVIKAQLHS